MLIEAADFVLSLRSPNWVGSDDQRTFYWSSTGAETAVPTPDLEARNLEAINSNWAAVLLSDSGLTLLEDVVRSHALLYANFEGRWLVSDHPDIMRDLLPLWVRDEEQAKIFSMTGFTLNEGTLIDGVSQVEASSEVTLAFGRERADVSFANLPLHPVKAIDDPREYGERYLAALDEDFEELIRRSDGRQLVVPLSGGLDSRLVCTMLRRHSAPNALAFTYGKPGIPEATVSRDVAEALEIPWVFIEMDSSSVAKTWFSSEADGFRADTWNASALPHVQDWYALRECRRRGLVDEGAIVIPGHTPVGAMHDEEILKRNPTGADVGTVIANHHFLGRPPAQALGDEPSFRRAIKRVFEQVPNDARRVQNMISLLNFRERQAKYINNSMTAYEHFGWDWSLPLYWPRSFKAWASGSQELTADRRWYRAFVDEIYSEQTGKSRTAGYFEAPAESARVPLRNQIVALSRKTGLSRPLNRAWSVRTQMDHPLGFEAFTKDQGLQHRLGRLLGEYSLMSMWSRDFLEGKWGSERQRLVPAVNNGLHRSNDERPTVLVISYSDISHDARLLKQIRTFSEDFDVTVCGHGEVFDTPAELLLFECAESRRGDQVRSALLHLGQYGLAQRLEPDNLAARKILQGRKFDVVVTNDIEPVGLAIDLFGTDRVHADLHEYYPGLQDQDPAWVKLRRPYYRWMLANNVAKVATVTTVSRTIAERYQKEFGFEAGVVENALPRMNIEPTWVHEPIRLVHAGAALPNRHIEVMMRAAARSTSDVTLDMYLTGVGTEYYRSLEELSSKLGERIRLHKPIVRDQLVPTLNQYDVGIHLLPATATNNVLALPNKFFDFIQARLAVVVGPTEEMARRVNQYDIGTVTEGFSEDALVRAIDSLQRGRISVWKQNSSEAAVKVDVTPMLEVWKESVSRICSGSAPWRPPENSKNEPLVDVIVAVHDPKRPIARTVASVLEHNRTPIQVIVVAHNLDPQLIAGQLGKWFADPRVLLTHLEDGVRSPSGPMNHGYDCATATFTALLGSDDTLEPGAVDRWVSIAEKGDGADFVIANRLEPDGLAASVPPVRPGHRTKLDGVKDRLAYRAAPLGLLRRSIFGSLRFPEGIPTGEDVLFSNHIWFSESRISFAFGSPGYYVHADQEARVTTSSRSAASELKWVPLALDPSAPGMKNEDQRRALVVKILRNNIPDSVQGRVSGTWSKEDREQIQEALKLVVSAEPAALGYLSRVENKLIRRLLDGDATSEELGKLLVQRSRLRSFDSLITADLSKVFSRQAPLRYHVAGWILGRRGRQSHAS